MQNNITLSPNQRSNSRIVEQHIPCPDPKCGSSDAYCVYDDGHGFCYSCNKYFNLNKSEAFISEDKPFTYEYLGQRGLSANDFRFFDAKTKIDAEGKPVAIQFKYPTGASKIRNLEKKEFRWDKSGEAGKAGLFGRDKFSAGSHKCVTITEGEYDAISLWSVLRTPVVSVPSASAARGACSIDRAWLNSFDRIYLAFDADEAGRAAATEVAKLFDFNKVYDVKFTKRKDANDYLQHGERDELINVWNNAKRYLPANVISSYVEFENILAGKNQRGVSYPFPTLDYMTYGIRTSESVLFKAKPGIGKTEIMHAIEHHLLKETDHAVGAIYLEETKRQHLQALAGIQLNKPVHLPDSGVDSDAAFSAIKELTRQDDRLHLYSHFGSSDPEVLLDTVRFLVAGRSCRYIILDHITMVVSGLGGDNERIALDYLSTRLEMMVKELDFSLIFVSHVNDNGLTRGSRGISQIADIEIALDRDKTSTDPRKRCTTSMLIEKNRPIGRSGPAGLYLFDQYTRQYEEIHDAANENGVRSEVA